MLKRYQVLLPDWLEEYIKFGVDRYGISFSEIIRLQVCFASLSSIEHMHPEYKSNITTENILNAIEDSIKENVKREDLKRFISKVYFETRKAIEYRYEHIS